MKKGIRIGINILIPVAAFSTWISMVTAGGGALTATGLNSLKYFTVLSNLMGGFAAVYWLIVILKNRGKSTGSLQETKAFRTAEKFKYIAAVCLFLTFATVVCFLGLIYGYLEMFSGVNFWFHLIVPVAAMIEVFFLSDMTFTLKDNFHAVIPMMIYGIAYVLNVVINGVGTWPDTNDWYAFFTWGYAVGALIFVVICFITWVLGWILRKGWRKDH